MLRIILLSISLVSFYVCSEEVEDDGPRVFIGSYRLPPVMVYVDASKSFKSEMLNDLRSDLEKSSDYCLNNSDYWFCQKDSFEDVRGFRGWDGNGNGLMIGFLCKGNNTSLPKQKYYSSNFFYRYDCIKVWHPVEDKHLITYPEND